MSVGSKKPIFATPRARAYAKKLAISLDNIEGSGPLGRIIEHDVIYHLEKQPNSQVERYQPEVPRRITPLAQNIANTEKITLDNIQGTGIYGKIISTDVFKKLTLPPDCDSPKKIPFSGIRKFIANKMSSSKRNAPHVTLTVKTEVTNLVNYKTFLKEKHNLKVSYTDLLVKIVAESLRQHKKMNVSLDEDSLIFHQDINIGVAVAIDEGLIVPVIKNADKISLQQISTEVKDKASKARTGKLKPIDIENGRFTISNLGMYDVDAFTPIINTPESAILGVGRIIEDIIVENQQIRMGKTMMLSLSFDHRAMDGAPAAEFLGKINYLIEHPQEINHF